MYILALRVGVDIRVLEEIEMRDFKAREMRHQAKTSTAGDIKNTANKQANISTKGKRTSAGPREIRDRTLRGLTVRSMTRATCPAQEPRPH